MIIEPQDVVQRIIYQEDEPMKNNAIIVSTDLENQDYIRLDQGEDSVYIKKEHVLELVKALKDVLKGM